jgi:hypothetical protein
LSLKFVFPSLNKVKNVPKYASFVNGPIPSFKVHGNLGTAKQSFSYRNAPYGFNQYSEKGTYHDGAILELVDGEWFVLYDVKTGTLWRDLPWVKKVTTWSYEPNPDFVSYASTPDVRRSLSVEHVSYRTAPMTLDEYASWRVKVDREIRGANSAEER